MLEPTSRPRALPTSYSRPSAPMSLVGVRAVSGLGFVGFRGPKEFGKVFARVLFGMSV